MGIERRDFIKICVMLGGSAIVDGCARSAGIKINPTASLDETPTLTPTLPVPTSELSPTPNTIELKYNSQATRDIIKSSMEDYGRVDKNLLSDAYWMKLDEQIGKYGPAKRITALEYHGDYYRMYNGAYSLTPEAFNEQMVYLCTNDYHFVTGTELVGYLDGLINLPARSVILTTDSGGASRNSIPRITNDFIKLQKDFGSYPHMISLIWTGSVAPSDWWIFKDGMESGFFSLGSHSRDHKDFGKLDLRQAGDDLAQSKKAIQENLGLNVNILSWPFETCFGDIKNLKQIGFKAGYGGAQRSLSAGYTYKNDPSPMCLPRLFPPCADGESRRPNNQTLEQILTSAMDKYEDP